MRFFFFVFSFLFSQNNGVFVDGVAAIVEDNIILKSDLNQMVNMVAIQQSINPNADFEKYNQLKEVVLGSMGDQKVLLEMAEEDTTIEVKEKEVNQSLDQQIDNIIMQAGGKKEAEKMLGQSIKSFRSEFWFDMKDKIISEKYQQKMLSKIKVSKKDVFSFFKTYKDSLPLFPAEAKVRHLLIKPSLYNYNNRNVNKYHRGKFISPPVANHSKTTIEYKGEKYEYCAEFGNYIEYRNKKGVKIAKHKWKDEPIKKFSAIEKVAS